VRVARGRMWLVGSGLPRKKALQFLIASQPKPPNPPTSAIAGKNDAYYEARRAHCRSKTHDYRRPPRRFENSSTIFIRAQLLRKTALKIDDLVCRWLCDGSASKRGTFGGVLASGDRTNDSIGLIRGVTDFSLACRRSGRQLRHGTERSAVCDRSGYGRPRSLRAHD
jgi:hypothetical protein